MRKAGAKNKQLSFTQVGECKICTSHKPNEKGHIRYAIDGKQYRLHRLFWERINGNIPKGKVIWHICGDCRCMNVEHMELITLKEKGERTNHLIGSERPQAKLSEEQVLEIINNTSDTQVSLAKQYDVHVDTIWKIKNDTNTWKHLKTS